MSPRYTPTVLEHFANPRHTGVLGDADAMGQGGGGPLCPEDMAFVWIKVRDGRIAEIAHKTMGCPIAIASSSMTCLLALGMTLDDAEALTVDRVVAALGGVPERKVDSVVAPAALRQAVAAYRARSG